MYFIQDIYGMHILDTGIAHLYQGCGKFIWINFYLLCRSLNSLELSGHLNADRLECLLKIPSRLKTLDISTTFDSDEIRADELPTILYKFLKKHSPTGKIFYPFGVRWWRNELETPGLSGHEKFRDL